MVALALARLDGGCEVGDGGVGIAVRALLGIDVGIDFLELGEQFVGSFRRRRSIRHVESDVGLLALQHRLLRGKGVVGSSRRGEAVGLQLAHECASQVVSLSHSRLGVVAQILQLGELGMHFHDLVARRLDVAADCLEQGATGEVTLLDEGGLDLGQFAFGLVTHRLGGDELARLTFEVLLQEPGVELIDSAVAAGDFRLQLADRGADARHALLDEGCSSDDGVHQSRSSSCLLLGVGP